VTVNAATRIARNFATTSLTLLDGIARSISGARKTNDPFIPLRENELSKELKEALDAIAALPTTESQITSGKAESIHDDHQFQIVLDEYINTVIQHRTEKAEWADANKAYNALIDLIEAVREKDRVEAFRKWEAPGA
jgi:hypothetical protein